MNELQEAPISQSFFSSLHFFAKNSMIEMKRRTCYYLLALISVIVVACAAQIAQTLTDKAQVIYLQAAEQKYGQIDITVFPKIEYLKIDRSVYEQPIKQKALFNYTQILGSLKSDDLSNYISARNTLYSIISVVNKYEYCQLNDKTKIEEYYKIYMSCEAKMESNLIFIDTERERQNNIGRLYSVQEIPKDQVVISEDLANKLNLEEGDTTLINADIHIYLYYLLDNYCSQPENYKTAFCLKQFKQLKNVSRNEIVIKAKVYKIIKDDTGKTSKKQSKNTIIMERKYFAETIYKYIKEFTSAQLEVFLKEDFMKGIKTDHLVSEVIINFPNRVDFYGKNQFDKIEEIANTYASQISNAFGFDGISIQIPIVELFQKLKYPSMFLNIVTNMIIIIFCCLSIMMLYNLLLVSVETKTYELGVLRIIGLNKFGVIGLIITQSLSFVIPGVIIGILIAGDILKIASRKLEELVGIKFDHNPSFSSYYLCLFIGIVVPLASSIVPIKRALSNSLSFALDKERSKSQGVKITVDIDGKNTQWGQLSFGLLSTLFGFSLYYLLPLSLVKMDLALLISIFFFILIGLLIGLILISVNFAYLFERFIVYTCFFWVGSSTRKIVLKNLASHRIKNTRTSIMYGLSIAFIVFIWSAMALQIDSQYYSILQKKGGNFVIYDKNTNLDTVRVESIFQYNLKNIVKSYTFLTGIYKGLNREFYVMNKGKTVQFKPNIVGVQPNYFKTVNQDFLKVEKKSSMFLDIVDEMYTNEGIGKMIISKQVAEQLFYTTDIDLSDTSEENIVLLEQRDPNETKIYKFQVTSIVSSFPGLNIQPDSESDPNIIVSIPMFQTLKGDSNNLFRKAIIDADLDKHDRILYQFDRYNFWSFKDTKEELDKIMKIIDLIFSGLGTLVMVLCFFSLISSMTANIYEQTKEIAILRAVGISKSFVLVFSSCIMGTLVGLIIGYSMSMQRQLFTEMAISYRFPWKIIFSQFIISLICAIGSTLMPIMHLVKQPISSIIRKTY